MALTSLLRKKTTTPASAAPPRAVDGEILLEATGVTKSYAGADRELPVLAGIDLQVRAGEIVALLGKSGSGKSTLLRCLAGLIPASSGTLAYRGTPLTSANPGTAMVFQTFALLPWLTVQQNVELGLEAQGVPADQRAEAALKAIDLIGLDGFESAYPKELSGGMRQRVGFARALVVEPDVLMMDEPFSALDVLTAENLRGELMELWESGQFPTRAVVLVTHNIEEAVLMADRIVILGSRPYGTIRETIEVGLDRPRDRDSAAFEDLIDRVYAVMTGRAKDTTRLPGRSGAVQLDKRTVANTPLPTAGVDSLRVWRRWSPTAAAAATSSTSPTTSASTSTTYCPSSTPSNCSAWPRSAKTTCCSPRRAAPSQAPTSRSPRPSSPPPHWKSPW